MGLKLILKSFNPLNLSSDKRMRKGLAKATLFHC
jgi:hypothetical protein